MVLLLLGITLSACGVRTAYNNLDWLTVRWVNQQVSLDRDQETMLRAWLDQELSWHCATQLGSYHGLIEQMRLDLLAGRLDAARLAEYGQAIAVFGRTLTERSLPMLTELAASLSDEQVQQTLAAFEHRTERVRVRVEEYSIDELAEDRLASMERSLRRIMGRSNAAQRQRLQVWSQSVTATEPYHLAQRQYWQERLAVALKRRDDSDFLSRELAALMRPESAWSEDYQNAMTSNRALTLAALEDIIKLADTRHINRMTARLTSLRDDFRRLSCEGDPAPALLAGARSTGGVRSARQ